MGYGDPLITEAVSAAMRDQTGGSGLSSINPAMVGLAEDLARITPVRAADDDRRVYLGNSGSDANDVVLRSCRAASGRRRILAFHGGYHGGIGLAMAVSGVYVDAGLPQDPDSTLFRFPRDAAEASVVLAALADELAADDVACLIVEPIQSDGGIVIPPPGFLADLADACRRADVLLIVDEVKVGLGRTGLMHAFAHEGIAPDVVTFGKALGGGLPLSAAVGPGSVLDGAPASALLTTSGNPVCAAAGRAVLELLTTHALPERAAAAGERLLAGLRANPSRGQGDTRGRGLTIGVDIVDPDSGAPSPSLARKVVYRAWQLGAVVFYVGGHVLEVTPALRIDDDEVDRGVDILLRAIADASAGAVSEDEVAPYVGW
jgi:4-aminobutyrate aminotransferase